MQFVIPGLTRNPVPFWIPAFAGMTPFASINVAVYNSNNKRIAGKRLRWYRGEATGDTGAQDPYVQPVQNRIKLPVQIVEKKFLSRFLHRMARDYCVWSVSKNRYH
jgi:hypothetical protein